MYFLWVVHKRLGFQESNHLDFNIKEVQYMI
jgi:hypothetical protein